MLTLRTTPLLVALFASGAGLAARAESPQVVEPGVPPVVAPGLDPAAAAFRGGLGRALLGAPEAERAAIDGFFAARGYAPFWTEPGSPRAEALVAALLAAGDQALPAGRYDPEGLRTVAGDGSAREVALTRAYLGYAGDLSVGVIDPSKVDADIITRRPARPPAAVLLAPLATMPVAEALKGLQPADPDYRRLVAEKRRLETEARTASWGPAVSDGPTLHPEDSSPRVAELRARLARLGYLAPQGEALDPRFDPALEAAVKAFQADHGLVDDGVVGKATLAAVNAPIETRLAQVAVNLERLRWMPRDLGERYLVVNIPDFTVRLVEDGAPVWESKVVVGKAKVTETAEFSDEMTYLVVNPSWHIPNSIAIRDYLPKLKRDPMVLKRQGIDLMTRGGTTINPKLVDFTVYTPENFPFRIKQRPSDDNALGKVKFMFPNQHSIYLHDTPHKEYFARDVRAYSNGCIRVEKPDELAQILLTGQVPDPAAAFDGWVAARTERTVNLARPVPIHIVYRTVFADETGTLRFRPDVYGRDARAFEALEAAGVTLAAAQG
jgi:murein L,D-transpeptidase YcbB/YkuD